MFVNPNVQIIKQGEGLQGIYDIIAQCSSTCYQSVSKSGSKAEEFVKKLINNGHYAMLEFGTVFLNIPSSADFTWISHFYATNPYSITSPYSRVSGYTDSNGAYCIAVTTNYRVIVENNRFSDLKYLCEPTEHHAKRKCVRLTTSIGVARELTRHRVFSFAQESTRYCNYSKDKFSNELSFIVPPDGDFTNDEYLEYINALTAIEKCYMKLIDSGVSPQIARDVLPLSLKTELCMCGFTDDWKHFFGLRCDSHAHPHMVSLAKEIQKQLEIQ